MNKYEILLNSLLKKYTNYAIELNNHTIAKEKLEKNIKKTSLYQKEKEMDLKEKEKLLEDLINANAEIEKTESEYKTLCIMHLLLGIGFSIAGLAVASNFTSSILIKVISMVITYITTTGIGVICDTYRKNKILKPFYELITKHSSLEKEKDDFVYSKILCEINNLATDISELKEVQEKRQTDLDKRNQTIDELNVKLYRLYNMIERLTAAKDNALSYNNFGKGKSINEKYESDPVVIEILELTRKKKGEQYE